MTAEPASFLNLDLELRCREDLSPLASYLDKHAMLLYSGDNSGDFQVTAEPRIGGHANIGPDQCTEEMLATLSALPEHLLSLFHACHLRLFDYGFDGGIDKKPYSVDLRPELLGIMARFGIGIRITLYPYQNDGDDQ